MTELPEQTVQEVQEQKPAFSLGFEDLEQEQKDFSLSTQPKPAVAEQPTQGFSFGFEDLEQTIDEATAAQKHTQQLEQHTIEVPKIEENIQTPEYSRKKDSTSQEARIYVASNEHGMSLSTKYKDREANYTIRAGIGQTERFSAAKRLTVGDYTLTPKLNISNSDLGKGEVSATKIGIEAKRAVSERLLLGLSLGRTSADYEGNSGFKAEKETTSIGLSAITPLTENTRMRFGIKNKEFDLTRMKGDLSNEESMNEMALSAGILHRSGSYLSLTRQGDLVTYSAQGKIKVGEQEGFLGVNTNNRGHQEVRLGYDVDF